MRLPWQKKPVGEKLARAVTMLTEGAAPDQRGEEVARGDALLEEYSVETSELGDLAKLPPFRPVVISLMRLFDQDDVGTDEIAHLVESDPSLLAELLGIVNSPLFALNATVTSPSQAVALLGFETTKALATTLGMRSMMRGSPRTPVVRRLWFHSLATSTIAQAFAKPLRVDTSTAYVGALLHDLGRLGLLAAHPEEYTALALGAYENVAEILAAEQERVGMTHCCAGEKLAVAWRLPAPICQAAVCHHDEASPDPATALVQLTCRLADDLQYQAILRRDTQDPAETIAAMAPPAAQEQLTALLGDVSEAIDRNIQSLDF